MRMPLAIVAPLAAFLAAVAAGPSTVQSQTLAPIAAPQAAPEAAPNTATKATSAPKGRRWLKADARVCLEFPTDVQVIACTEKYR